MKAAKLMIAGLIFTIASASYATPSCNHNVSAGRFAKTTVTKTTGGSSGSSSSTSQSVTR